MLMRVSVLSVFASGLTIKWAGKPENRIVLLILDPGVTSFTTLSAKKEIKMIRPDPKNQRRKVIRHLDHAI